LLAATNQYFEGIEQNNGNIVPFDDSCSRFENGIQTAGKSSPMAMGCRDQFNSGGMFWTMPERRFWAVDEDLGVVMGIFMFRSELPEKAGGPPPMMTPMMAHNATAEMFKIRNGRIYQIEAVIGPMLPYGQRSGW
jgi:hypothetical protein